MTRCTWTNATENGEWKEPGNWLDGIRPKKGDSVLFTGDPWGSGNPTKEFPRPRPAKEVFDEIEAERNRSHTPAGCLAIKLASIVRVRLKARHPSLVLGLNELEKDLVKAFEDDIQEALTGYADDAVGEMGEYD